MAQVCSGCGSIHRCIGGTVCIVCIYYFSHEQLCDDHYEYFTDINYFAKYPICACKCAFLMFSKMTCFCLKHYFLVVIDEPLQPDFQDHYTIASHKEKCNQIEECTVHDYGTTTHCLIFPDCPVCNWTWQLNEEWTSGDPKAVIRWCLVELPHGLEQSAPKWEPLFKLFPKKAPENSN